jgi:hypothetical protein
LAQNQDIYEKATALRLQFEHEKQKWESTMKVKMLNNAAPIVYDTSFASQNDSTSAYRRPKAINNGPPFVDFPSPQQRQQGGPMAMADSQFEYEIQRDGNLYDKENIPPPNSSWNADGFYGNQQLPSSGPAAWDYFGQNPPNQLQQDKEEAASSKYSSDAVNVNPTDNILSVTENSYCSVLSKKRKFSCPIATAAADTAASAGATAASSSAATTTATTKLPRKRSVLASIKK